MSTIATALKHMLAAGMPHDAVVAAVAEMEAGGYQSAATTAAIERPAERRPDPVWVYVIGVDHPDDTLVKVGISKHPHHRLATLEKERGYNLYLAHTEGPFTRRQAADVERRSHAVLAAERERGEWFWSGVERAADVVRSCATASVQ